MVFGVLAGLALAALLAVLIGFLIGLVIIGGVIYVAGRMVVGERAKLGSAVTIAVLGVVLGGLIGIILPVIGWIIALVVWIYLIKRFFSCGWPAAFGVGLLAVIIWVVIWIVLAAIVGIGLLAFL
jgi:hypothetical protein